MRDENEGDKKTKHIDREKLLRKKESPSLLTQQAQWSWVIISFDIGVRTFVCTYVRKFIHDYNISTETNDRLYAVGPGGSLKLLDLFYSFLP